MLDTAIKALQKSVSDYRAGLFPPGVRLGAGAKLKVDVNELDLLLQRVETCLGVMLKTEEEMPRALKIMQDAVENACPECAGSGKITVCELPFEEEQCPACDGTGEKE